MNKSSKSIKAEEIRINRTELIGTIALQYLQSIQVKATAG